MHIRMPLVAALAATSFAIAGSTTMRAAEQQPLLPVEFFFANPHASWAYRVSPDGNRLAWIAMRGDRATLHFRRRDETVAHPVETKREARSPSFSRPFWWARDSRHILFLSDTNGDENAHLFVVDTDAVTPAPRDLTPLEGARVEYVRTVANQPNIVIVRHNGRTGGLFDLYRLNITNGQLTMIAENSGDVCWWSVTPRGGVRLRFRCLTDGGWTLDIADGIGGWRQVFRANYGDGMRLLGFQRNLRYAWALSDRGRERMAVVRLDLRDGSEQVVYDNPEVDIAGGFVQSTGWLRYVWAWPGRKKTHFFDAGLQADLSRYLAQPGTQLHILSEDRFFRFATFGVESDRGGETFYLLDRRSGEATVLAASPFASYRDHLAAMQAVTFPARDGLPIHALLTRPVGAGEPHPMVLMVHGGPWSQDHWGFNPTVQFLANRGYAVLQVEYRGSTGFGRKHLLVATREFGRNMHNDLIDGVHWAIAQGVADPKRIAIMGASFGGYAALSGAAFTPDVFVAAVDRVGVSDWASIIEQWPRYWRAGDMGFWKRFFGDPKNPADRKLLTERSPVFHTDAIRIPMLVAQGANDVRVPRDQSDRVVAALRARKQEVEYIVFPDEGHPMNGTANTVAYLRAVEHFLAKHLGGREERPAAK